MMKEKLEMSRHISALAHRIKDMEEMMKKFPVSMERDQSSQPNPQMASGALIHVPCYMGNLPFRVWKKVQDIVQNNLSNRSHHSTPHVAQIIIPQVPDVGRIWADTMLLSGI